MRGGAGGNATFRQVHLPRLTPTRHRKRPVQYDDLQRHLGDLRTAINYTTTTTTDFYTTVAGTATGGAGGLGGSSGLFGDGGIGGSWRIRQDGVRCQCCQWRSRWRRRRCRDIVRWRRRRRRRRRRRERRWCDQDGVLIFTRSNGSASSTPPKGTVFQTEGPTTTPGPTLYGPANGGLGGAGGTSGIVGNGGGGGDGGDATTLSYTTPATGGDGGAGGFATLFGFGGGGGTGGTGTNMGQGPTRPTSTSRSSKPSFRRIAGLLPDNATLDATGAAGEGIGGAGGAGGGGALAGGKGGGRRRRRRQLYRDGRSRRQRRLRRSARRQRRRGRRGDGRRYSQC